MKLDAETLVLAKAITGGGGGGGGGSTVTLIDVPTFTSTMTYNGTEQTASFNNYDADKMTVSGNTATNAGTYTAKFKPKKGYYWDNGDGTGTNEPKEVSWSIGKATASITLSESAITLDVETLYTDVSITAKVGTGALSVVSSDTTVATVGDIENDTFRITANNDDKSGSATITVSMVESENYTSASATVAVNVKYTKIYGVEWDGSSNPAWTRTDAAANFSDPNPYYSGMSGTPSSPFDNCMPWSGMEIVEDTDAGTLVKIPKFWYKLTRNGDAMKLQIADGPADGFSVSPAHQARNSNESDRDYVYIGRYHCGNDFTSKTGVVPVGDLSLEEFRTGISNLGSDIWQNDFAMFWTIRFLYLVEFAHWNCQEKIGYGSTGSSSQYEMGYTDNMPYHTGTTKTDRTIYGLGTQYRYIEGLWENALDYVDGIYLNGTALYYYKDPSDYSSSVQIGDRYLNSGYISKFNVPTNGYDWAMYPIAVNGSESTYICDYTNNKVTGGSDAGRVLRTGGSTGTGAQSIGLFTMYAMFKYITDKSASTSSRVMKLPNAS